MNWSDVMVPTPMARERLFALRETISRLENEPVPGIAKSARKAAAKSFDNRIPKEEAGVFNPVLPLGIPDVDTVLQGGLPLAGLMEIRSAETRDAGAAMGFVLALAVLCQANAAPFTGAPLLWIGQGMTASEAGLPYGRGLEAYGLDVSRFIVSSPRSIADALWVAEAALSDPIFAAVVLEVRGNPANFGLTESRRLHLRARSGKVPLFLLRQAGEEEASSALFRFLASAAPAAGRVLADGTILKGSIGNPVFRIAIEKSKSFAPSEFFLEWSSHVRRFRHLVPGTVASPQGRRSADSVAELSTPAVRSGGEVEMGRIMAFKRAS